MVRGIDHIDGPQGAADMSIERVPGAGTATFLAAEMFKSAAGVNLLHVPYRGGGEALIAVVTGEVSVYLGPMATVLPQVQHGKLRGLAVTTLQRTR